MERDPVTARAALGSLLRHAYSGERAAALAYRGHWRSLADGAERRRIREIEADEWRHRECVGGMLAALGEKPDTVREARAAVVGRVLSVLCHVSGRLAPLYAAGRLESVNIREYERAVRLALASGRREWVQPLLEMAEVEWEHERFFRTCVAEHPWARWIPLWTAPAAKREIRRSFRREAWSLQDDVPSRPPAVVAPPAPASMR